MTDLLELLETITDERFDENGELCEDFTERDFQWYACEYPNVLTVAALLQYINAEPPVEHIYPLLVFLWLLDAPESVQIELATRYRQHEDYAVNMMADWLLDMNIPYRAGMNAFWRALARYAAREVEKKPAYQMTLF